MASTFYPSFFRDVLKGEIGNLESATVKCMLLKNTYLFNNSHSLVSQITAWEVTNTDGNSGYIRKTVPVTIDLDVLSESEEGAYISLDLNNSTSWPTAYFTARYAAIYVHTGADDSLNKLIYLLDLGTDRTSSGSTFQLMNPNPQPKIRRL